MSALALPVAGWAPWAEEAFQRIQSDKAQPLDYYWAKPQLLMEHAGMPPDPWQVRALRSVSDRLLLLCSRQSGKSQIAAALALKTALLVPDSTTLILSRAQRQSAELLRKVKDLYRGLASRTAHANRNRGRTWRPKSLREEVQGYSLIADGAFLGPEEETISDAALSMEFANGSRIISLPGTPDTLVGYSAITLLIIDEAARTSDALYYASRPFLATSQGRMVVLSTPFGKRGWFWESWRTCLEARGRGLNPPWETLKMTAENCPRIRPSFLQEEREAIGELWYGQEYLCEFRDTVDAAFRYADIHDALSDDVIPLSL